MVETFASPAATPPQLQALPSSVIRVTDGGHLKTLLERLSRKKREDDDNI